METQAHTVFGHLRDDTQSREATKAVRSSWNGLLDRELDALEGDERMAWLGPQLQLLFQRDPQRRSFDSFLTEAHRKLEPHRTISGRGHVPSYKCIGLN